MVEYTIKKVIDLQHWNNFIQTIYGKPYNFQQQDGCKEKQAFSLDIPSKFSNDEQMNDSIPEVVNGKEMGVKFDVWVARDPEQKLSNPKSQNSWSISLWWERNFYPDIYTLANDLYKKGLIEAGEYIIDIDW